MAFEMALTKEFTPSQQAFITEIAKGLDPEDAAIQSGYSPLSARVIAWDLLQQPQILAAVQIAVARQLAAAAPLALRVLKEFVADVTLDKRLRVVCAKTLLDRAGHIAPKAAAAGQAGDVPLNELSMADLRQLADKLEGEIAGRAKDVSSAKAAPRKPQAIEDII